MASCQVISEEEAKACVDMLIDDNKIEMSTEYKAAVDAFVQGAVEGWRRHQKRMEDLGYFTQAE